MGLRMCLRAADIDVVLCDVEQRFLDRALETIGKNLEREVAKNKITAADKAAALGRIQPVTDRAKLADCDFVIEAATEKFEIKTEIFRDLDRVDAAGNDSGVEYVFDFDYQAGGVDQAGGESYWDALLQSGAGDETGGGDSRAGDFAGNI